MKNAQMQPLILLTCIFAAFTIGFFAGRTFNRAPVQIQTLPAAPVAATVSTETEPTAPVIININTATAEELQTLPGVGSVLAERIITYRNEHGGFESVGDLINISGIGEKMLETIWDMVTIGG